MPHGDKVHTSQVRGWGPGSQLIWHSDGGSWVKSLGQEELCFIHRYLWFPRNAPGQSNRDSQGCTDFLNSYQYSHLFPEVVILHGKQQQIHIYYTMNIWNKNSNGRCQFPLVKCLFLTVPQAGMMIHQVIEPALEFCALNSYLLAWLQLQSLKRKSLMKVGMHPLFSCMNYIVFYSAVKVRLIYIS